MGIAGPLTDGTKNFLLLLLVWFYSVLRTYASLRGFVFAVLRLGVEWEGTFKSCDYREFPAPPGVEGESVCLSYTRLRILPVFLVRFTTTGLRGPEGPFLGYMQSGHQLVTFELLLVELT